jgi:hypothetical protein
MQSSFHGGPHSGCDISTGTFGAGVTVPFLRIAVLVRAGPFNEINRGESSSPAWVGFAHSRKRLFCDNIRNIRRNIRGQSNHIWDQSNHSLGLEDHDARRRQICPETMVTPYVPEIV